MNILVIDTGSSSMRGLLFDGTREILFKHQVKYSMTISGLSAVQCAEDFEHGLVEICAVLSKEAAARGLKMDAIALTSQRSSVLPVDRDGRPLSTVMMWYDKRSQPICDALNAAHGEEVYRTCGMVSSPVLSAPKIRWYKDHEPEIYGHAYKFIGIHDYLVWLLTGTYQTDVTLASRSNLMDIHTCSWSDRMFELYGIEKEKLCELRPVGEVAGTVQRAFSAKTGIPEGTPIISSGGDQQCSAVGQSLLEAGKLGITTGSGSYVVQIVDEPVIDPQRRVDLSLSAVPGKWMLEASNKASGTVFDWCRELLYGKGYGIADYQNAILQSRPGANGVIMLPDLAGKGCPIWDARCRGSFINLGFDSGKEDFARAGLEAIVADIWDCYRVMRELGGEISAVSSTGGLSKFPLFNQVLADMTARTVEQCAVEETTGIGAWAIAAVRMGLFSNLREALGDSDANRNRYDPDLGNNALYARQNKIRFMIRTQIDYNELNQ